MALTPDDERYQDILELSEYILAHYERLGYQDGNDTPQGRMIYQVEHILEVLKAGEFPPPIEKRGIATLNYCSTEGHTDMPERETSNLLFLLKFGNYLLKPQYYNYVYRELDELAQLLEQHYPQAYDAIMAQRREMLEDQHLSPYKQDLILLDEMLSHRAAEPEREGIKAFRFFEDITKIRSAFKNRELQFPITPDEQSILFPFFDVFYRQGFFEDTPVEAIFDCIVRLNYMLACGCRPNPDGSFNCIFYYYKVQPLPPE